MGLGGNGLVLQSMLPDRLYLDLLIHLQDFGSAAVISIGRGSVTEAHLEAAVNVVLNEGPDLTPQFADLRSAFSRKQNLNRNVR